MTQNNTKIWVDVLPDLTNLYNNTIHRSIGIAPNDVNFENAEQIRQKLYGHKGKSECTLKLGDIVRIPVSKNIFSKGYDQNWTKELYTISKVESSFGNCWYKGTVLFILFYDRLYIILVKNKEGREQKEIFYKQQLNLISRA